MGTHDRRRRRAWGVVVAGVGLVATGLSNVPRAVADDPRCGPALAGVAPGPVEHHDDDHGIDPDPDIDGRWELPGGVPEIEPTLDGTHDALPHPDADTYAFDPEAPRDDCVASLGTEDVVPGLAARATPLLPYPPDSVWATTVADGRATVHWLPAVPNGSPEVTGYEVRAEPGGATTTVAGPVTSAALTGLAAGTTYTFTVRARNVHGMSEPSDPSVPVGSNATPPVVPFDLGVVPSWTEAPAPQLDHILWAMAGDVDGGLVTVQFEVRTANGSTIVSVGESREAPEGAEATWTVPGALLLDGATYTWRARAFDGLHASAWTAPSSFTVDRSVPRADPKGPPLVPIESDVAASGDGAIADLLGPDEGTKTGPVTIIVHGVAIGHPGRRDCEKDLGAGMRYLRQEMVGDFRSVAFYENDFNCTDQGRTGLYAYGDHKKHFPITAEGFTHYEGGNKGHTNNTNIKHLGYHLAWYIYTRYTSMGVPVNVVGWSMGGLMTRWALYGTTMKARGVTRDDFQSFPPPLLVTNAITLGTPHMGSHFGGWRTQAACQTYECHQMTKDSGFTKELRNESASHNPQGRGGTDWTVIGSGADNVVGADSATGMRAAHKVVYYVQKDESDGGITHFDYTKQTTEKDYRVRFVDDFGTYWSESTSYPSPVRATGYALRTSRW